MLKDVNSMRCMRKECIHPSIKTFCLFDQIIETVHIINQKKFNGIIPNLHPLKLLNRSPLSYLFLSILSYTMF